MITPPPGSGPKNSAPSTAGNNDDQQQGSGNQPRASSSISKQIPENSVSDVIDTPLTERQATTITNMERIADRILPNWLLRYFYPKGAEAKKSNKDDDVTPTLDLAGNTHDEMLDLISDALGFPVDVKKAMESAENAKAYTKEVSIKQLDLESLLKNVRALKSNALKEEYFYNIFQAKSLEEWEEFAVLQMLDPDEFAKNCGPKFNELVSKYAADDPQEAQRKFQQEWKLAIEEPIKAMLDKVPPEKVSQLHALTFLIKWATTAGQSKSGIAIKGIPDLLDKLDLLVDRKVIDDLLSITALPEGLRQKLLPK